MHGHVAKGAAPLDQRRIKVGMRNGDRPQAAEAVNQSNRGSVDERDAVPKYVAVGGAHEQRALTDGKGRLRANANQARFVLTEGIEAAHSELVQCRPGLSSWRCELTLIRAHPALSRR